MNHHICPQYDLNDLNWIPFKWVVDLLSLKPFLHSLFTPSPSYFLNHSETLFFNLTVGKLLRIQNSSEIAPT